MAGYRSLAIIYEGKFPAYFFFNQKTKPNHKHKEKYMLLLLLLNLIPQLKVHWEQWSQKGLQPQKTRTNICWIQSFQEAIYFKGFFASNFRCQQLIQFVSTSQAEHIHTNYTLQQYKVFSVASNNKVLFFNSFLRISI